MQDPSWVTTGFPSVSVPFFASIARRPKPVANRVEPVGLADTRARWGGRAVSVGLLGVPEASIANVEMMSTLPMFPTFPTWSHIAAAPPLVVAPAAVPPALLVVVAPIVVPVPGGSGGKGGVRVSAAAGVAAGVPP
jgi:hypothetical protein